MFEYDYSFCAREDCFRLSCRRHLSHAPKGVPFSMSRLHDGDEFEVCEWYMKGGEVERLNLNTATEDELVELGLSRIKAARIIVYRDSRGGFRSVRDLLRIRSVGKTTYDKVCDLLYVEEPPKEEKRMVLDEQQREWMLRITDATEWMCDFLNKTFPRTWCKLRFEHVDAAAYWFTFELVNDDRRQTWSVRHSDLEGNNDGKEN